jgi:vacuolar-type H+-ATPase subunit H
MKSTDDLLKIAAKSADKIKAEIFQGGGKTINSISRMETEARLCAAALNQIKARLLGTAREET